MFISKHRHCAALAEKDNKISSQEARILELEAQLEKTKIDGHDIVESMRYALGASAITLRSSNQVSADMLHCLGESLPYVLSGHHQWPNRHSLAMVPSGKDAAERVATEHGIGLPNDPALSVRILLEIAIALMLPERSSNLDYWRATYPSRAA